MEVFESVKLTVMHIDHKLSTCRGKKWKRNAGDLADLPERVGAVVSGVRQNAGFPREGYGHVFIQNFTCFTEFCQKPRTTE